MKVIQGTLFGLIALLALRYAVSEGVRTLVTSAATNKAASCLTMAGNTTREEEGLTYIIGSIRNNCDRRIDHVTITFKLDRPYGSKPNLPETPVYAYSNDVQPNETRQFKTLFQIGKNTTYRFDGITAY